MISFFMIKVIAERCPQNHPCPVIRVCRFGAITQKGNDAPVIDEEKCTECMLCVRYCGYGAFSKP